jgi:Na+-transporting NADH:ubiquinone oxidoreductase subunit NqrE
VHEARAARTTRGLLVALSATLLAALAHSPGALALVVALAFSVPTIAAQCVQLGMVQFLIDGGRLVIATMAQTAGGQAGWVVAIRMAGRPSRFPASSNQC